MIKFNRIPVHEPACILPELYLIHKEISGCLHIYRQQLYDIDINYIFKIFLK